MSSAAIIFYVAVLINSAQLAFCDSSSKSSAMTTDQGSPAQPMVEKLSPRPSLAELGRELDSPWSWKQTLDHLRSLATDQHSQGLWVEQLHATPDVFLVHNFLSEADCAELINLHNAMVLEKDEFSRWCFSRAMMSEEEFRSLLEQHDIPWSQVVPGPDQWCVNGRFAAPVFGFHPQYHVRSVFCLGPVLIACVIEVRARSHCVGNTS